MNTQFISKYLLHNIDNLFINFAPDENQQGPQRTDHPGSHLREIGVCANVSFKRLSPQ